MPVCRLCVPSLSPLSVVAHAKECASVESGALKRCANPRFLAWPHSLGLQAEAKLSTKQKVMRGFRETGQQSLRYGKSFGFIGCVFTGVECYVEQVGSRGVGLAFGGMRDVGDTVVFLAFLISLGPFPSLPPSLVTAVSRQVGHP